MKEYKNFLNQFYELNDGKKKDSICSFLKHVQYYYSCKCQLDELEKVKKHIEQMYGILSIRDFLLEELCIELYEKYESESLRVFIENYRDIIEHLELPKNIVIRNPITMNRSFLKDELLLVTDKFKSQYSVSKYESINVYFEKLHHYMDIYKHNKDLELKDMEEAFYETISEEGVDHLMQAMYCQEGLEMLYIQPILSLFVMNADGTCSCNRSASKLKFKKERTNGSLKEKKEKIQTNIKLIDPYYKEYLRTTKLIHDIWDTLNGKQISSEKSMN